MFRIGIIGTENSHARAFTKVFNEGEYDCKVVAVGGHYPEESKKLCEEFNLEFIADEPRDMLGRVDAVMVTARDGKYHLEMVRPFIEAGIPAFVDKPVTVSTEEALELAKLAKKKGVPVCGGSSVRHTYDILMLKNAAENGEVHGGMVSAPLNMHNEYSGFYFYSSHLAEMSLTIFGYNPKSVMAYENNDNVTALVKYDNYIVTNHFMNGCYKAYQGVVMRSDMNFSRSIDISLSYKHECDLFVNMLKTGKSDISLENLIIPVFYLNAVEKSYKTGVEEKIIIPEI